MKIKHLIYWVLVATLSGCGNSDHQHYQGYVEGEGIYLASPFSGVLIDVFVKRGQHVKLGELLFKLDPEPQYDEIIETSSRLMQAQQVYHDLVAPRRAPEIAAIEAQISQANAQLSLASMRVKRNQELLKKHVLDQDSVDASVERYHELTYLKAQYEANLTLAKLGSREYQIKAQQEDILSLKAKVELARWKLAQKSIYAPKEGVVFDTYFSKGEFVDASRPIAVLLTPDDIQIQFYVSSDALPVLHLGKKITFNCDGCAKNNPAVIQYISPEAEYVPPLVYSRENKDNLVFRIKASISNATHFKPGQPVIVTVSKRENPNDH